MADNPMLHLEPQAGGARKPFGMQESPDFAVQLSIAISLKRIADRLDENTSHTYSEPAFRMRGDMA